MVLLLFLLQQCVIISLAELRCSYLQYHTERVVIADHPYLVPNPEMLLVLAFSHLARYWPQDF